MKNLLHLLACVFWLVNSSASAVEDELQYASRLLSNGEYGKAVKLLQQNKFKDNSFANYSLGVVFMNGDGVNQDYGKAVDYFEIAAKQQNIDAMINLAGIYLNFPDDRPRPDRSYYWMLRAAQQEEPQALAALASMHFKGDVFPPDDNYGVRLALMAQRKGWSYDQEFLKAATRRFSNSTLAELKEQAKLCQQPFDRSCPLTSSIKIQYGYVRTSSIEFWKFDKGLFFDTNKKTPLDGLFNHFARMDVAMPWFFSEKNIKYYPNKDKADVCILDGKYMDLVWYRTNSMPEGKGLEFHPKDNLQFTCERVSLSPQ